MKRVNGLPQTIEPHKSLDHHTIRHITPRMVTLGRAMIRASKTRMTVEADVRPNKEMPDAYDPQIS